MKSSASKPKAEVFTSENEYMFVGSHLTGSTACYMCNNCMLFRAATARVGQVVTSVAVSSLGGADVVLTAGAVVEDVVLAEVFPVAYSTRPAAVGSVQV